MKWQILLTRAYLWPKWQRLPHSALLLPALGLIAGVVALLTTMTGINGFQKSIIDGLQELSSYHLRVSRVQQPLTLADQGSIEKILTEVEGVKNVTAFIDAALLLSSADGKQQLPLVRAVSAQGFNSDVARSKTMPITQGIGIFTAKNQIILGRSLARRLQVNVGSQLQLLSLDIDQNGRFTEFQKTFIVQAIYRNSSHDIENNLVFIPLYEEFLSFYAQQELQFGLKIDNLKKWHNVSQNISKKISGLKFVSSYEFNRGFFTALRTEKAVLTLLMSVIFLAMAMQIYQSLLRQVMQHKQEIALLLSLGAPQEKIRSIFLFQGALIATISIVVGTAIGALIAWNINPILAMLVRMSGGIAGRTQLPHTLLLKDVVLSATLVSFFCMSSAWFASRPMLKLKTAVILSER